MAVVSFTGTENMSICQESKVTASSDTLLSDTSFKSAQSHASVSQSSSPHKKNSLWELFEDREEIVPESFSCIDHRVRLFLEVSIFKQEEMFVCFLEVSSSSLLVGFQPEWGFPCEWIPQKLPF